MNRNTFSHLSNAQLAHELDFLVYENGRIGRGHAKAVALALEEATQEMNNRGFTRFTELLKAA